MNAREFLLPTKKEVHPPVGTWLFAGAKTCLGVAIIWGGVRMIPADQELLRGWTGLVGLAFLLHFGLFHLLALFWQRVGVNAQPLMRAPVRSVAVAEFLESPMERCFPSTGLPVGIPPVIAKDESVAGLHGCVPCFRRNS